MNQEALRALPTFTFTVSAIFDLPVDNVNYFSQEKRLLLPFYSKSVHLQSKACQSLLHVFSIFPKLPPDHSQDYGQQ